MEEGRILLPFRYIFGSLIRADFRHSNNKTVRDRGPSDYTRVFNDPFCILDAIRSVCRRAIIRIMGIN